MGNIPKNEKLDSIYCQKFIKPVLDLWNVNSMIVGHTPTFITNSKLNSTCDESLWRIDVGLSSAFKKNNNFNAQYIEILDDSNFNIFEIVGNKCNKIN